MCLLLTSNLFIMNPRRKFLLQGGLVSTALLSFNPFQSMANKLAPLTGFSMNSKKVILVHTFKQDPHILKSILAIRNNTGNVILLHSGKTDQWNETVSAFDVSNGQMDIAQQAQSKDYSIVYKGNYKIGVITPSEQGYDVDLVNKLSGFLKKERNCDLVICLSSLGYKNNNAIDDVTLAENSTNLDIIIGGHVSNYSKHPVTVLNKLQEEVIINHSLSGGLDFGKIEIEFDDRGNKRNIAFNHA